MLDVIRKKLAGLYAKNGDFKRAAQYWGTVLQTAEDLQKEQILAELLNAHLRGGNLVAAGQLVENILLVKDLARNNPVVNSIDNFLTNPGPIDPNVVLAELGKIKPPQPRPVWRELIESWKQSFVQVKDPNKPKDTSE